MKYHTEKAEKVGQLIAQACETDATLFITGLQRPYSQQNQISG